MTAQLELRNTLIRAAAEDRGLELPAAECHGCGCALYATDEAVRPVDCDNPDCPAAGQLEAVQS